MMIGIEFPVDHVIWQTTTPGGVNGKPCTSGKSMSAVDTQQQSRLLWAFVGGAHGFCLYLLIGALTTSLMVWPCNPQSDECALALGLIGFISEATGWRRMRPVKNFSAQ